MGVIETDKWLLQLYNRPIAICEKLKALFKGARASEIYDYLIYHGMYQPGNNGAGIVEKLQSRHVWEIVKNEFLRCKKEWDGPDVPIYIFPSDPTNLLIQEEFNGKAGLAFKDKLFLFVSARNSETEIRSLFTHEYNHVCRLTEYPKDEADYVLLDTIILEGLAENAVREKFGPQNVSSWAFSYPNDKIEKIWKQYVYPNRDIKKAKQRHQDILYGLHAYPKMSGYCTGYYLVNQYLEKTGLSVKDVLKTDSKVIAQINSG
ncbi:DUF2268 domain-containing protein [Heyndrickxia acidiproducens]|uniref:DUF2268 domain-containing protein n=1 Tax=Heyndrickxia acidiproducens TaxID=1121084 RepID=UPI00037F58B3|nr:DUF2268 domain-containing protein [Heyndrickxia acidiproducens]